MSLRDFKKGGLICPNCRKFDQGGPAISQNAIKILRMMLKQEFGKITKIKIEAKFIQEVYSIAIAFLKYILEGDLNTEKFLRKIN